MWHPTIWVFPDRPRFLEADSRDSPIPANRKCLFQVCSEFHLSLLMHTRNWSQVIEGKVYYCFADFGREGAEDRSADLSLLQVQLP
jgi:hypothetical protein